jgi:hypothetical protein
MYHDLIYHDSLEKVFIVICSTDQITITPDAAIALFLFHHSWYETLADTMHLYFITEDDKPTNQQKILAVT